MAGKNSFVLRISYGEIFAEMSDKQAGMLIKAIFNYVAAGEIPAWLNDIEAKTAFKFIKQDIDYDTAKYDELCEKRSEWGKKGAQTKASISQHKQAYAKPASISQHDDVVSVVDVVSDVDNKLLTADKAAEQAGKSPNPKKLNALQNFSNSVIAAFEDNMNDTQKGIWFKRNCRCLSDILNFCGKDIPLALETISVCVERLEKAGLKGGYEAVCRNLPDYYEQAKARLEKRRINAQESEF